MRRLAAPALLLAAASLAAGCGSVEAITAGGTVIGGTMTVYSSLPAPGEGAARDIVDGEKLAVVEAGGTAGGYKVNFASLDEVGPDPERADERAAIAARQVIADPQVIAEIGALRSETAMVSVPLFNAAGILQVSLGAGYPGFTERVAEGEPARWLPSGRRTFVRLVGDDRAQARALLAAARAAAGSRERPRVAIEQEAGPVADALADALRRDAAGASAVLVGEPARADAIVYAGEDPGNAAGVAEALAREAPRAAVVLPDALTRAGIAGRLAPAARRRAVLVSAAPEPGSTPALRAFAGRFRARLGRDPGPYAALGYEAMRSVLAAVVRAGAHAGRRQAVIDAYRPPPFGGFTAFRLHGRQPGAYLRLG